MDSLTERLVLHPFSAEEARRVVDETPSDTDLWAADYPFEDERDPLRSFAQRLAVGTDQHPFTMYRIDEVSTGLAIGGLGFFNEPDESGVTELGYGLVASARGNGYATEALVAAIAIARSAGARKIVADTGAENVASQRVLTKAGFAEISWAENQVYYAITL